MLRRSVDGGQTWSSPTTIVSGNIDFYTGVWDAETNTVWLMLQKGLGIVTLSSRTQGLSWSTPTPFTATPIAPYKVSAPAVGHGIQISAALCVVSG